MTNEKQEHPHDLTNRFVRAGSFEKHFAPWRVNLQLDHQRYLRERTAVRELLSTATRE